MCRIAAPKMDKFDVFFSSGVIGSCFLSASKHSLRCALRFFSSLLCTSLVPALTVDGLLSVLLQLRHWKFLQFLKEFSCSPVAVWTDGSPPSAWHGRWHRQCTEGWLYGNWRKPLIQQRQVLLHFEIIAVGDTLIEAHIAQARRCTVADIPARLRAQIQARLWLIDVENRDVTNRAVSERQRNRRTFGQVDCYGLRGEMNGWTWYDD